LTPLDLGTSFRASFFYSPKSVANPEPVTAQMRAKLCVFNPRASPLTSQSGVSTELLQNHLVTVVVAATESFSNDMLDQLRPRSEQHLSVEKSRDP